MTSTSKKDIDKLKKSKMCTKNQKVPHVCNDSRLFKQRHLLKLSGMKYDRITMVFHEVEIPCDCIQTYDKKSCQIAI